MEPQKHPNHPKKHSQNNHPNHIHIKPHPIFFLFLLIPIHKQFLTHPNHTNHNSNLLHHQIHIKHPSILLPHTYPQPRAMVVICPYTLLTYMTMFAPSNLIYETLLTVPLFYHVLVYLLLTIIIIALHIYMRYMTIYTVMSKCLPHIIIIILYLLFDIIIIIIFLLLLLLLDYLKINMVEIQQPVLNITRRTYKLLAPQYILTILTRLPIQLQHPNLLFFIIFFSLLLLFYL